MFYIKYSKICHHLMPGGVSGEKESVLCLIIQHAIRVLMSLGGERKRLLSARFTKIDMKGESGLSNAAGC